MPLAMLQAFLESVAVTRTAAGAYVNGRFVAGAASNFTIQATVLPLDAGEEMQLIDAGERTKGGIVLIADTGLQTANQAAGLAPDVVSWNGNSYQVRSSTYRSQLASLAHHRVVALLMNP